MRKGKLRLKGGIMTDLIKHIGQVAEFEFQDADSLKGATGGKLRYGAITPGGQME